MADKPGGSNVDQLIKEGLLERTTKLTDADYKAINSFSEQEMAALLSIKRKLSFKGTLTFTDKQGRISFF